MEATRRPTILLASANPGKVGELRALCADLPINWLCLADLEPIPEPKETGETLSENARIKAIAYSRVSGYPALADDSGLEVDWLGGRPGVDSAYFAGQPRDDAANNRKLLEHLEEVPALKRTAQFRSCLALAVGDRVLLETEGVARGRILDAPRGTGGFGYDALFYVDALRKTFAELDAKTKNQVSHRGAAFRKLRDLLPGILPELTHS